MQDGLGVSVKVKVPKELKLAAKNLPETNKQIGFMANVLDASNVTIQVVLAVAIVGIGLYFVNKYKKGS